MAKDQHLFTTEMMIEPPDDYGATFVKEQRAFIEFASGRLKAANVIVSLHAWARVIGFLIPQIPTSNADGLEIFIAELRAAQADFIAKHTQ